MSHRLIALLLSLVVIVGFSVSLAQIPATDSSAKALDPDVVAVRLVLGIGDATPRDWSGRATVDKGEVLDVEGLRFRDGDKVTGRDSWKSSSRFIRKAAAAKKAAAKAKQKAALLARQYAAAKAKQQSPAFGKQEPPAKTFGGPGNTGPTVTPNGVILSLKNVAGATLTFDTEQGRFSVVVDRLADGTPLSFLNDRVSVQRVFPHAPLYEGPNQQDFPAATPDSQGAGAWIAAVWHEPRGPELLPAVRERPKDFAEFTPTGGGDQVRLFHFQNGKPTAPLDVTEPGRDVWRPAVATAGDGGVIVVWTEKRGDNWDLFGRRYDPKTELFSPELRMTEQPGPDSDAVLATAANGTVWLAWQAWTSGQADILLVPLDGTGKPGTPPIKISDSPANEWAPSIAADSSGRVHVAFDSYQAGNYDVSLRTREADGTLGPAITVAGTSRFEARPQVAADARGRAWVAYEERTPHWGKDAVNLLDGKGSSLYRASKVVVKVVDGGRVYSTPDPLEHAPAALKNMNSYPRLIIDRAGRPWLTFRHRQEAIWGNNAVIVTGAVWTGQVTSLSGTAWSPPQPLTRGDSSLDNRPALVQPAEGPVLAFYSSDGRLRREVEMNPQAALKYFSNQGTPPGVFNVDLEVSALAAHRPLVEPRLTPAPRTRPRASRSRPSTLAKPPTSIAFALFESSRGASSTACSAASSTGTPKSPPTAAPTGRLKICGDMHSMPPRSTGSATATTTTAAAKSTPGG